MEIELAKNKEDPAEDDDEDLETISKVRVLDPTSLTTASTVRQIIFDEGKNI